MNLNHPNSATNVFNTSVATNAYLKSFGPLLSITNARYIGRVAPIIILLVGSGIGMGWICERIL